VESDSEGGLVRTDAAADCQQKLDDFEKSRREAEGVDEGIGEGKGEGKVAGEREGEEA
jgi:hypothetical protein